MIPRIIIIGSILILALTSCKALPEYKNSAADQIALITSTEASTEPKNVSTGVNAEVTSKTNRQTKVLNKIYTPVLKNARYP